MASPAWRGAAIAAAASLVVGFGGGYVAARMAPVATATGSAGPERVADRGFGWPFFGRPRAADAPRAGVAKPDGFAVWTSRLDTRASEPSACIRMTRALDPRRSYGDFVNVDPALDHPAAVTVQGDELCVAGVGYGGRKIVLLHGLPSATGETLAEDATVDVAGASKPPFVGFVGDGVILPREDADGVGLETVNVTRLAVEVWRVPDRNLVRKTLSATAPTPEDGYASDYGEEGVGDDGRKVWSGTVQVRGALDQRTTTVFPLGAVLKTMVPGAYQVRAADASGLDGGKPRAGAANPPSRAQARRWILFTDMALQAYDGSDALDVTVRSLKTARAMAGVRVALVGKDGVDLASAPSDATGRVRFARALLAGEDGAKPARIMAYGPNADFTTLDLDRAPVDLSKQDVGGRASPGGAPQTGKAALDAAAVVDGFLYADRGVYRPGETVHLVGLLRDHLARAVKARRGALVIRRPSGLEFSRVRFDSTPDGAVSQNLTLPANAPRGQWKASLEMDGSDAPSGAAAFQVEDFVPQRLAVTIDADAARPVVAGEVRRVGVEARFLYGATAAGLPVQADARVRADPKPFPAFEGYAWGDQQQAYAEKLITSPATTTDGAGRAVEVFDTTQVAGATQPLTATFSAQVFEPGGRPVAEEATLPLRLKPLYLGVKTTSGAGETPIQSFDVIAVDAYGRRRAAPSVTYTLIAENWNYDWFEENGRWSWRRTSRDTPIAKGLLSVGAGVPAQLSKRLAWGDYRLVLEEPLSGARTVIRQASGWGEPTEGVEAPDTARVSAVRTDYRTGDTVELRIQAPFAGEAQVAVATDRLIGLKTLSVGKDGATVRLHADAAWGGGAYVLVSVVQPRDPVSSPKPRRALGLVYVPLDVRDRKLGVGFQTPAKIDSKVALSVPIVVRGLRAGGRAHVTIAAVDEGILRLTHQKNPDPAAWYFGKRALGLAYRDDYGRLLDPNLGAAAAVTFGGDEMGGAGLTTTPIKTVALWSGVVETDAAGRATVRLPASPEFDGQLRLVAVAWTDDGVGSGASDVIVRQPVVTELTLPRFLSPGDRMLATLELHNVEARVGDFVAEVVGRSGVAATFRNLWRLVTGQRVVDHLLVAASDRPGVGRVDLRVTGPGFATTKSWPIQTRIGWGAMTRATTALQAPGEAFTPTNALLSGLSPGDLSMTVSYSSFRGFDPAPIADSLSRYPYGCSEQLVSVAYPLLYAPELGHDPRLHTVQGALVDAVSKLLDREALDGSFGLWRVGDGEADGWLGGYIVDFLLEAKAHGAPVPEDALARALGALRLISRPDGFGSVGYRLAVPNAWNATPAARNAATARLKSRAAAYALYDLAKASRGDLPRLRWFHDVGFDTEPSPLARAQVGAGLAAMGDRGRAHDSFVQAVRALGYKAPDDLYQSPLRDVAGVIALAWEAGETGIARALQGRLEDTVRAPDALNTQEQARLLQAAHGMAAAAGPIRIEAVGVQARGAARWAVGRLAAARFVDRGGPIWRTVTVHGLPVSPPAAESAGLRIEKRLFAMDGSPVDPAALRQGQRVIVRLTGGAAAERPILAVVDDALPAGLEIESTLTPDDAAGTPSDDRNPRAPKPKAGPFAFLGVLTAPSTQDKRDDRYVAAMTLQGGHGFALAYVARAVTPGDMFLPGASARDMYRPAVHAQSAAGRMRIAVAP